METTEHTTLVWGGRGVCVPFIYTAYVMAPTTKTTHQADLTLAMFSTNDSFKTNKTSHS